MFTVKKGILLQDGKPVPFVKTPNHGGKYTPEFLIMHYTAATTAGSTISWFSSSKAKASAHLLIDRSGNVTQFAPFDVITWHAGVSEYEGEKFLNDNAIGIEFVNAGRLFKNTAGRYVCPVDGKAVTDFTEASNIRGVHGMWQDYTEDQIAAGVAVAEAIRAAYKIKHTLGHEDIAPGRKEDPGPRFPWNRFKVSELKKTTEPVNIRRDGMVKQGNIIKELPGDLSVKVLNTLNGWGLVETQEPAPVIGWVNLKYIS